MSVQPTKITVVDCDKKMDTAISFAVGQAIQIYLDEIPAHWCLKFEYSGRFNHALYWLDKEGVAVQQWSEPRMYPNKYTPIKIPIGDHSMGWACDAASPQGYIPFTVAQSRPAQTTNEIASVFGTNFAGANWPQYDPISHPELPAALKAIGMTAIRFWLENDALFRMGDAYWTICRAWRALGFSVLLNLQYQYTPGKAMYSDADLQTIAGLIPADAVHIFSMGNEINTRGDAKRGDVYYLGSIAQMIHATSVVAAVMHPKGIRLAAPSYLNDNISYQTYANAGGFAFCDFADMHYYKGDGASIGVAAKQFATFCSQEDIGCLITEWGTRPGNRSPDNWASEQSKAIVALKALGVTAYQYSALPLESLDDATILTADYKARQPFYASYVSAVAGK